MLWGWFAASDPGILVEINGMWNSTNYTSIFSVLSQKRIAFATRLRLSTIEKDLKKQNQRIAMAISGSGFESNSCGVDRAARKAQA